MAKYSIGIPVFKGKYLKYCISSILQQELDDFELIIVNDASPDNIDEIVKEFLADSRITYKVNDKNSGAINVVDNWNKCLKLASGEFFLLMGDDDSLEPDFLAQFSKLIDKYPEKDVFHCRSYIMDENSNKYELTPSWPEEESVYENIYHRMKTSRIQFISDFVYRTSALKNNGGFFKLPLAWGSDDITSFILMERNGIAHTNKPVFNYRRSPFTISNSGNSSYKLEAFLQYESWLKEFLIRDITNFNDQIFRAKISNYSVSFFKKKKQQTITKSFSDGIFKMFFYWLMRMRKYNIGFDLLGYSIVEHIKRVRS